MTERPGLVKHSREFWINELMPTFKKVLYISPRLYKHSLLHVKLSVLSLFYLKVGGGQLESLRYFDHHTHLITGTVIILFCNRLL